MKQNALAASLHPDFPCCSILASHALPLPPPLTLSSLYITITHDTFTCSKISPPTVFVYIEGSSSSACALHDCEGIGQAGAIGRRCGSICVRVYVSVSVAILHESTMGDLNTHTHHLPPPSSNTHTLRQRHTKTHKLTSRDAEREKVEKAATPMAPKAMMVLPFQFLGLGNHPPEGVQIWVGK